MEELEGPSLWVKSLKQLTDTCNSKLKGIQDESLTKCKKCCVELNALCPPPPCPDVSRSEEKQVLSKWIQLYTQAVLDMTFHDENKLVDEEFPRSNSKERMQALLEQLRMPTELLLAVPDAKVIDLLGEELLECLAWRQGALCYMYCSTVDQTGRLQEDKPFFLQCASDGASYLQQMMSIRLSVSERDFSYHDAQALTLLKHGAYSDTHVIAMMYAGEMCYWYCKHSTLSNTNPNGESFNASVVGRNMLTTYLNVIQGPLKGQGWQVDKARELLVALTQDGNNS